MKIFERIILFLGSVTVIALSVIHSMHGTDSHHWGFIMGTALDLIQGKKLFHEIYIQYGLGQPFLFQFLNYLFPINFSTVGMVTGVVYAINLCMLFAVVKKIGGSSLALMIYAMALLIHTYSIFPWPNYYSGLFLTCAIYMLIRDGRFMVTSFLAGAFLFVAFLFRSTYLVSILSASFVYGIAVIYNPNLKSKKILASLTFFFVGVIFFSLLLSYQGNLGIWFEQSIASGTSKYALGVHDVIKTLRKAFWPVGIYLPDQIVNTSFVALFYVSIIFLFKSVIRKITPVKTEYVFIALLGLAGLSQVILSYEFFRLQNDCISLLIIFSLVIKNHLSKINFKIATGVYFILLLLKFPNASALFPLYDGGWDSYQSTSIHIFKFHRLQPEVKTYYEKLADVLCKDDQKIINLTPDSTIPYLCELNKNDLPIPFYSQKLSNIQNVNIKNKWIVVDQSSDLSTSELKLNATITRPAQIRFFGTSEVKIFSVN